MIALRPLTEADLETLAGFLAAPHVSRWWHADTDLDAVRKEYLPGIRGEEAVHLLLALDDSRPLGFAQWYLWDDHATGRDRYGIPAGAVGIDYLVGAAFDCERGWGTALIAALLDVVPPVPVWVTPEAANEPSCRVLEKNGFERMAVKQVENPEEPWAGPTALYRLIRD